MNADWTSPVQPDHLEPNVNQDITYPRFLEEQDAMDAMLWGDVPIPPINTWCDSQDITGFGADSYINSGCVCDFPPLYCEQHGVYGDMSITYPDDVLESVEAAPGCLESTEENLIGQSLIQAPFEKGHANFSMPTNDQSSSLYTANDSPISINPQVKRRLRRSKICSRNRHILKAQYLINPYPSDNELAKLHKRTRLDEKCIKTWFTNTRHRTAHGHTPVTPSPQESRERSLSETPSQASTSLSAANLRELDRLSPARSITPLERYLDSLFEEESILPTAIDSLSNMCPTPLETEYRELRTRSDHTKKTLKEKISESRALICKSTRERQLELDLKCSQIRAKIEACMLRVNPDFGVAGSVVNSDNSIDSVESAGSWISQNSVDSRGPRRGRKSWVQVPNQFNATASTPAVKGNSSGTTEVPKPHPWYCTRPSCDQSFQFRYEWDRHETAVHHWPYHWVCNLDQDTVTIHKDAASRIFYREDQLIAHMKGSHPGIKVTKRSVAALKQNNPDFDPQSLRCGFCQQTLRCWEERQDHVAAHIKGKLLQERLPKSSWLVTQG